MDSNRNNTKDGSRSPCCSFGLTLIVIFSLSIAVSFAGCMEDIEYYDHVNFRVTATASGPSEIIVPIPVCDPVVDKLKVSEGKGEFTIIETIHGTCLRIRFDSRIVVSGTWTPDDGDQRDNMTINLTTMDPNETEPYSFSNRNTDIPDMTIWVNWSYGPEVEFIIRSTMNLNEIDYKFSYDSHIDNSPLEFGWNKVFADGYAGVTNAP